MKKVYLIFLLICPIGLMINSCKKNHKNEIPPVDKPVSEVHLGDSLRVNFPPGAVGSSQVSLNTVADKGTKDLFLETASFYDVDKSLPYAIVLNIGDKAPKNDSIRISIKLPDYFRNTKPSNYGYELFAKLYQKSENEVIDNFSLVPSSYNPVTSELTAYVPSELFTNARTSNHTFEAVFMVGTTPGENLSNNAVNRKLKVNSDNGGCEITQIGCPLGAFSDCQKYKGSPFGLRKDPITNETLENHRGVDFKIVTGTPVYAASDGIVKKAGTGSGYGQLIFLRHIDGTATLYAHLSKYEVTVGQAVKKGQLIARSGNTGDRTTGQHLHFEFYPFGGNYADKSQKDPFPCITEGNVDGSITVRDNGNLADDAFAVYLDDKLLGQTGIGAKNSIAANNLRPGTKTLKLVCLVAPDNQGTYEIILNDGLKFSSGILSVSGVLTQGGSSSWQIVIPPKTGKKDNSILMRMNNHRE